MLDPRRATDALSSRVNRLIYQQLIDFNEASEPIADLADWQQISADHYRFTLRKNVVFHHGKPLTSEDILATYQSILDTDFGSPHRGTLSHIKKIEAINPTQVDFILSKADALFVGRLTLGILPADLINQQHNFAAKPIGSGQAYFVSLNEQRLVLQRADQVELHFVVVKDPMVRVLKLQKGELDCVQNDLSPELVNYCTTQAELKVDWQKGTNYSYIGFNLDDPWLSQPQLRQAIAHGLDRQLVIDAMFQGQARLAGGLLPPEHWAGHPDLTGWNYNPDKARDLLKAIERPSAAKATPIRLSFKTSSDPTRIRLATLYQAQLKPLGIDLQVQSYDWGTFYNDIVQGRFQLFSLAWVGIKSPDIFQYVFSSDAIPPKGANRGRYRNSLADELIKRAGRTQDLGQQAELYRQLQTHLQATLPIMPLWFENQYAVMRKNLQGYQLFADGRLDSLLTVVKKV
ncbi:ABC transporter substrate-binding protein [Thiomicrospira sp. R3]|uniref:ABC transporter substrate-binding protein n=1 Tax=Thiomicrospira sp. R3 TaxID=3035472 RepID=UPI00259BB695|nr:ABC transporter substrate-binding protein [Thiomicrospira sp. R3]WFE68385.1 ABC transporter substrate-binding protein [Thiomicrospira sp. R3]